VILVMAMWACAQEAESLVPEPALLAEAPVWTAEVAIAPILAAMDRNGDQLVHAAEYQAVRGHSPGFREVDLNGDGVFSMDELSDLVERLDPQTWDEAEPPRPLIVEAWRGRFSGEDPVRQLSEWMRFLRSELAVAEPERPLPTDDEIQAAAETGRHDSTEVQTLIESLAPGSRPPVDRSDPPL